MCNTKLIEFTWLFIAFSDVFGCCAVQSLVVSDTKEYMIHLPNYITFAHVLKLAQVFTNNLRHVCHKLTHILAFSIAMLTKELHTGI